MNRESTGPVGGLSETAATRKIQTDLQRIGAPGLLPYKGKLQRNPTLFDIDGSLYRYIYVLSDDMVKDPELSGNL